MYSYYRRLRTVGRARAWYAAKVDRRTWDEWTYPPPPLMRHPGIIILLGEYADLRPSYIREDRYSYTRGMVIESRKKLRRLHRRREAKKYWARQKRMSF